MVGFVLSRNEGRKERDGGQNSLELITNIVMSFLIRSFEGYTTLTLAGNNDEQAFGVEMVCDLLTSPGESTTSLVVWTILRSVVAALSDLPSIQSKVLQRRNVMLTLILCARRSLKAPTQLQPAFWYRQDELTRGKRDRPG